LAYKKTLAATIFGLIGAGFLSSAAYAQAIDPNTNPGQLNPGQLEKQFESPQLPKSGGDKIIPDIEEDTGPVPGADISFQLKDVEFEGMTAFQPSDFADIYKSSLGESITLADVFSFAAKITARYRNSGYILSRAIIPPQRIADGTVKIQVIEGFISNVKLEGQLLGDTSIIDKYGDRLEASQPLDADQLERFVLLTNDLPGASARVVLLPSETTVGASDLVVFLEQDDYEKSISVDNRGSRYLGPIQTSGTVNTNSMLDNYDRLGFRYITSSQVSEFTLYEMNYTKPISGNGSKLSVSGTRTFVQPGFDLEDSEIRSDSTSFSASYSYPHVRSREKNLTHTATFNYRDAETFILGSLLSEDRVRSLELGTSYDFLALGGVNLIGASVSHGIEAFNEKRSGSPNLTRGNGRSNFGKMNLNLLRLQSLTNHISLYMSATGQYAFSQLLSSEEFGYGGAQYGRAYDPSEITGDHGVAALVELRYQGGFPENEFLRTYEFYTFYDFGNVWSIDDNQVGIETSNSAASAGLGTRLGLFGNVSGSLEVSWPLTEPVSIRSSAYPEKGTDPRLFFSLITSF